MNRGGGSGDPGAAVPLVAAVGVLVGVGRREEVIVAPAGVHVGRQIGCISQG